MKHLLKLALACACAFTTSAQTPDYGRTFRGVMDANGSTRSRPFRVVTTAPSGSCTTHEWAWSSTATNLYYCPAGTWAAFPFASLAGAETLTNKTLTLPVIGAYTVSELPAAATANRLAIVINALTAGSCNAGGGSARSLCRDTGSAWEPVGDGGSGAMVSTVPLLIERISDTQVRVGNNCNVSIPCVINVGSRPYSKTAGFTVTIAGTASGDLQPYFDAATGNFLVAHNTAATVTCSGCTTVGATATHPIDSRLLATIPFATNVFGTFSETWNKQGSLTVAKRIVFGANMGGSSVTDDTITFVGSGGGASPAGSGTELQIRSSGSTFAAITGSSFAAGLLTLTKDFTATTNSRARFFENGANGGTLGLKESAFGQEALMWTVNDRHGRPGLTFGVNNAFPSVTIMSSAGMRFTNQSAATDAKGACASGARGHFYPIDAAASTFDTTDHCIQTASGFSWATYMRYIATSTGAATATLGTNSPTVTTTPRGWVTIPCPDDLTASCYMPYWK